MFQNVVFVSTKGNLRALAAFEDGFVMIEGTRSKARKAFHAVSGLAGAGAGASLVNQKVKKLKKGDVRGGASEVADELGEEFIAPESVVAIHIDSARGKNYRTLRILGDDGSTREWQLFIKRQPIDGVRKTIEAVIGDRLEVRAP